MGFRHFRTGPAIALWVGVLVFGTGSVRGEPLSFQIKRDAGKFPKPISARVFVMLGPKVSPRAPRFGPDFLNPQPFFAVDARDWKADEPLSIGSDALAFPGSIADLKPGTYSMQAVIRLNPDTHDIGAGEGNAYGPVVVADLDPKTSGAVKLTIDSIVEPTPFKESDRVKLVDIPSPLLSEFFHRPIRMRAAVILPEGLKVDSNDKRPTLYIIPGFGGSHTMAPLFVRDARFAYGKDFVRVVLDPDCGTGHHVFADSANNGPRGKALIEEMIPYLEKHFPVIRDPKARLLNGHSSGGWSSLWLQVTYPDQFGGTWSTSPDPVDFHAFQTVDIYAPHANAFRSAAGAMFPVARMGDKPVVMYENMSKVEDVTGPGGQLGSFEAVFSPKGTAGEPAKLWDRKTGVIDPAIAKAWEKYDIKLVLERNAETLLPKLKGKIHVITGEDDTFYLEDAVKLLAAMLKQKGSDAQIEIQAEKNHFNLMNKELADRLDREMNQAMKPFLPSPPARGEP